MNFTTNTNQDKTNKINCILLVDDMPSTNFYNKNIITRCKNVGHIEETSNGQEAINYLLKKGKYQEKKTPKPDIIFLDINMPKMNGFEFLEKFTEFPTELTDETIIVMLTTSSSAKEQAEAKKSNLVFDFLEKPLTKEKFTKIANHFSQKKDLS